MSKNNSEKNATPKETGTTAEIQDATKIQHGLPATTMGANATKMKSMAANLNKIKDAMAEATAEEVLTVLQLSMKQSAESTLVELPTPSGHFLAAKMASAMWMSLRDELVSGHMRVEKIQEDKLILSNRMEKNEFRSDTEKAGATRTLNYYEGLEEKYAEIIEMLSHTYALYNKAAKALHDEDDVRQQGIPEDERTYTQLASLRWVSASDKTANPATWERDNDLERLTRQAKFWIQYNT